MELSLDEIIREKRIKKPIKRVAPKAPVERLRSLSLSSNPGKPARRIADARLKIIQKRRAKIRDAREVLSQAPTRYVKDARHKIEHKQYINGSSLGNGVSRSASGLSTRYNNGIRSFRNGYYNAVEPPKARLLRKSFQVTRPLYTARENVLDIPRGYVDYDNMERMEEEEYAAAKRLSRTLRNDMDRYNYDSHHDLVSSAAARSKNEWPLLHADGYDPFDVYEVPPEQERRISRPISPELPPPPVKGILRTRANSSRPRTPSPEPLRRRYMDDSPTQLSYEMRTRLERAPDPHASMGIFANEPTSKSGSSSGYRIVVSNLHHSVTASDIKELFEDIGELYDSHIVRPGVAEVIYKKLSDAEKAVETYHNRQLDRMPMNCLLVNPRSSSKPTAPAIKMTSSGNVKPNVSKTPLEIDIDTLHKVLFH